jgi:hypothetical protein
MRETVKHEVMSITRLAVQLVGMVLNDNDRFCDVEPSDDFIVARKEDAQPDWILDHFECASFNKPHQSSENALRKHV